MPEVKINAYDNRDNMPETMKEVQKKHKIEFGECTLYVGDKGLMPASASGGWQFIPYEMGKKFPKPEKVLPAPMAGRSTTCCTSCGMAARAALLRLLLGGRTVGLLRLDRTLGHGGRGRQEGRVGRGQDDLHQHARTQLPGRSRHRRTSAYPFSPLPPKQSKVDAIISPFPLGEGQGVRAVDFPLLCGRVVRNLRSEI